MARVVGADFANQMIVPELLTLLNDENSELHINIVQNLKKVWNLDISELEGDKKKAPQKTELWVKMLDKIFNKQNNSYNQWRVRVAAIELVALMSLRVSLPVFKETYEAYFIKYIEDKAAAVR